MDDDAFDAFRKIAAERILLAYGITPAQLGLDEPGVQAESPFRPFSVSVPAGYHDENCPCDECRYPWSDAYVYLGDEIA